MKKYLCIILGVLLNSIGLFFLVLYLNLFNMGYTFIDFVKFIIVRWECYLLPIGALIIYFNLERIQKK